MHWVHVHILNRRNLLVLLAALLAGMVYWYVRDFQDIYESLRQYLLSAATENELLAGIIFFVLAAASAVLTFFSSTPIVPVAIELFGRPLTLALIVSSWLTGGVIAYWVCYYLRRFVETLSLFKKADAHRAQLSDTNDFWLVLLFRLMVPAELGSYALGLLHYPFWAYVLVTLLGEFPFAIIATYSSEAFVNGRPLFFTAVIALGMVLMGVTAHLFYRRLRARNKQQLSA